ncbi:2'-deoxycytidine 5'-triphosphate deaminase [Candidatus Endowatersipora endosymbiont of Watersipora subatra]|uniref:2'-deoxycytidine 5'-triphosphate deaminase n=1 Tax=Candidatus Endowatersipora endosymbiont of Watersipora subatra TaxID=3077946 RepID=UPI00312CA195
MMIADKGILSDTQISQLFRYKNIVTEQDLETNQIQPASLDLRLGKTAWRVRASFLPGKQYQVFQKLNRFLLHQFDLTEGAVLEKDCVYIVQLIENLCLPQDVSASANPKSSTGRLDIFTRLITDYAQQFDIVPEGYKGPLYLEISPLTFPIIVRTESRLSQIRFRRGIATLSYEEMLSLQNHEILVAKEEVNIDNSGVAISIDMNANQEGLIGYRGKRHTVAIDVDKKGFYNPLDFWEPLFNKGVDNLILDPDEFYILVSCEFVHIPPNYAAEMVPFDPFIGEFRVHYAGFFDPGFGNVSSGGARAVLEVRSHKVPFILEHGQIVGHLIYEQMLERPNTVYGAEMNSHYQGQSLKLSKHFR